MNFRSPPGPDYLPFERSSWRGWVHRDWQEAARDFDLDSWQEQPHEIVRERPTAKTVRMKVAGTNLYLKRITGTTDNDPQNSQWINRIKWQTGRRSALRTLRMCLRMNAAGFQTPKTLLAVRNTRPSTTAEMVLTQAIDHPSLGRQLATSQDPAKVLAWLESAGRELVRLHRAGFLHGDFGPGNLIIQAPDCVVFLDNERTRSHPMADLFFFRKFNLEQMSFRLLTQISWKQVKHFLDSYFNILSESPRKKRKQRCLVIRRLRRRSRHWLTRRHRRVS